MPKIKIDISSGIFEVEGDEKFVREIHGQYKDELDQNWKEFSLRPTVPEEQMGNKGTKKTTPQKPTAKPKFRGSKNPKLINNLNLSTGNQVPLKDFFKEKSPKTALEKNAVFVFYMEKKLSITGITPNHVFTCYKEVNERVPEALRQSLVDTHHNKGWINASSMTDVKLTTRGDNFVEHDLPKQTKSE